MKTASFLTYEGPGRVSIARGARGVIGGFRVARELAPGPWFKSVSRPEYERRYAAQLALLDPAQTVARLHELAAPHEPVLLCWEEPPFSKDIWCHRHLVAAWVERHTGKPVPEYEPPAWATRKLRGDFAALDDGDRVYRAPLEPWMTDYYMARDFAGTHNYDLTPGERMDAKLSLTRAGQVVASGVLHFIPGDDGNDWMYERAA